MRRVFDSRRGHHFREQRSYAETQRAGRTEDGKGSGELGRVSLKIRGQCCGSGFLTAIEVSRRGAKNAGFAKKKSNRLPSGQKTSLGGLLCILLFLARRANPLCSCLPLCSLCLCGELSFLGPPEPTPSSLGVFLAFLAS